jgi:hypothetical protein
MANSKFDAQLERMNYLMGYKTPVNESKQGHNIEYHTIGADDKVYGILKEGNMYYIKTTEKGKEALAESYEYIGGHNYRNENGYKSYNEATKQLELRLMSLNENYGKKLSTSTVDLNRSQKAMTTLTEAARAELDRMHQIFENSQKIGKNNVGDPESKGKATDPTKQGEPFEKEAKATLDKDLKENGTVKGATPDSTDVKGVESDLQSDKMKTKKVGTAEEPKAAHVDLEGKSVADQKPKGAKAVKMNEGLELDNTLVDGEAELGANDSLVGLDANTEVPEFDDNLSLGDEIEPEVGDEEESLEDLLREFMEGSESEDEEPIMEEEGQEGVKAPSTEALDGHMGDGNNNVAGEETMDRMDEEEECCGKKEDKIVGPDKVLDGPHGDGNNNVAGEDTMDRLAESICDKFFGKKDNKKDEHTKQSKKFASKETSEDYLEEAVKRIVSEEITRLDAWGKHPRYQKPAFQTPANKEVSPNNAKDWNDETTRGEQPYGKKIGKGAPFDQLVDLILDDIKKRINEGKLPKKA